MNHDNAIKTMAAERYVLGELEPAERDEFEEHFFDCTECTADVRDAAKIADGVRTGVRVAPVRHYSRWAAAAAGAAVAIGLAYQYVPQVARLGHHSSNAPSQAAQATAGEQFIELDTTRAAQTPYVIVGKLPLAISFIIPVTDPHPPYICQLRDKAGVSFGSTTVSTKDDAANAVSLVIPAGKLHSGDYTLGIRGGDREIPAYHFAVEVQ
ncbi:MAG TPA: zf-HC2 domain-containing protein [Thermoanaerobaculia bacterium]|jgi:hypothetical protein|nr:zf-HC2 domain-containing protein [Thermoanaerobaculia bacterium]